MVWGPVAEFLRLRLSASLCSGVQLVAREIEHKRHRRCATSSPERGNSDVSVSAPHHHTGCNFIHRVSQSNRMTSCSYHTSAEFARLISFPWPAAGIRYRYTNGSYLDDYQAWLLWHLVTYGYLRFPTDSTKDFEKNVTTFIVRRP